MADHSNRKTPFASVFVQTLVLSLLLAWLPAVGPFAAAYLVAKRVRSIVDALPGVLCAALVWAIGFAILSQTGIRVGKDVHELGNLALLIGLSTSGSMLAGMLAGSAALQKLSTRKTVGGAALILFAACAGGDVYAAKQIWPILNVALQRGEEYKPDLNKACPDNLKQLFTAMQLYADSWDGQLPPAENWLSAIRENVSQDEWLHCPEAVPSRSGNKYGYAMNKALSGKRLAGIPDAAKTPLLYDSKALDENAHDASSSLPTPGRHGGRNNVLFADGTVAAVAP